MSDLNDSPTAAKLRIWGCYAQKIQLIDSAEQLVTQLAVGTVEVLCHALVLRRAADPEYGFAPHSGLWDRKRVSERAG